MAVDHGYFATCNGETVRLTRAYYDPGKWDWSAPKPGWKLTLDGVHSDSVPHTRDCNMFAIGTCPTCGNRHFAARVIKRPANAKNHKCDGRCMHSKGRVCECSCGGKNHGAGG